MTGIGLRQLSETAQFEHQQEEAGGDGKRQAVQYFQCYVSICKSCSVAFKTDRSLPDRYSTTHAPFAANLLPHIIARSFPCTSLLCDRRTSRPSKQMTGRPVDIEIGDGCDRTQLVHELRITPLSLARGQPIHTSPVQLASRTLKVWPYQHANVDNLPRSRLRARAALYYTALYITAVPRSPSTLSSQSFLARFWLPQRPNMTGEDIRSRLG